MCQLSKAFLIVVSSIERASVEPAASCRQELRLHGKFVVFIQRRGLSCHDRCRNGAAPDTAAMKNRKDLTRPCSGHSKVRSLSSSSQFMQVRKLTCRCRDGQRYEMARNRCCDKNHGHSCRG